MSSAYEKWVQNKSVAFYNFGQCIYLFESENLSKFCI